jgi:hypothetical protein
MSDEKQLTIHFNNGAKMDVTFPAQTANSTEAVLAAMKKALEADKLAIEADGRLVVIPWSSVQHIELTPVPVAMPFGSIKGARISQ